MSHGPEKRSDRAQRNSLASARARSGSTGSRAGLSRLSNNWLENFFGGNQGRLARERFEASQNPNRGGGDQRAEALRAVGAVTTGTATIPVNATPFVPPITPNTISSGFTRQQAASLDVTDPNNLTGSIFGLTKRAPVGFALKGLLGA